ncbi:MAG: Dyp-type peroxidase [Opitutales bacterium]
MHAQDGIQALVFTGLGSLQKTRVVWLRDLQLRWLRAVLPELAYGRGRFDPAVQLLLTASGARQLGASDEEVTALGREFAHGMTHPPSRLRLGDRGAHDPMGFRWTDAEHEGALLLYGNEGGVLDALSEQLTQGVSVSRSAEVYLPPSGREPFGFLDGITRVHIARPDQSRPDAIPAGAFVFGHSDHTGAVPDGGPLGHNGSLVILRELAQDVRAFWDYFLAQADGKEREAILLAAKAIGRWPNGMPLLPGQTEEPPFDQDALDFASFAHDRTGSGCPFGSHVRRANPRDGLVDSSTLSQQISAQHTLLRRGRLFGPPAPSDWYPGPLREAMPVAGDATSVAARGLFFVALCTDIRRQFEFVTQNWLMAPKFAGLYNEVDPLLAHADTSREFSIQTDSFCRHLEGVGGWVRPRGGGYYLLPGRGALERLLSRAGE